MNNWINKIVEVDGVKYVISKSKIAINDLITNGIVVTKCDFTNSTEMGFYKIIATEDEIGFVQLKSNVRLFDLTDEPEIEYVPFTKRWMDAILNRNGICDFVGVIENKLVLDF